jgi:hypothetical protein
MSDEINFSLSESERKVLEPELQISNSFDYSTRVKLGIALIVLVILTSSLRQLRSTLSSFRALPQTDDISVYERRFTDVKQFLPPNQFVAYGDEFDKLSKQCDAFVLAQYAFAPTVLVALDSKCRSSGEVLAHSSRLVLYNSHDPRSDPYLLRLFPNNHFPLHDNPDLFGEGRLSGSEDMVLLKDFGLGVRLYSRTDK